MNNNYLKVIGVSLLISLAGSIDLAKANDTLIYRLQVSQKPIAQDEAISVELPESATIWLKDGSSRTGKLAGLDKQNVVIADTSKPLSVKQIDRVEFQGEVWVVDRDGTKRRIRGEDLASRKPKTWQNVPLTEFQLQNPPNTAKLKLAKILGENEFKDLLAISRNSLFVMQEIRFESPEKLAIQVKPVDK